MRSSLSTRLGIRVLQDWQIRLATEVFGRCRPRKRSSPPPWLVFILDAGWTQPASLFRVGSEGIRGSEPGQERLDKKRKKAVQVNKLEPPCYFLG